METSKSSEIIRQTGLAIGEAGKNELEMEGINAFGYGTVSKFIMQRKDIPIQSKAIYAYLASYTGAGRTCFPSIKTIAEELACSESTVKKYLRVLEAKGIVKVEKRFDKDGGCASNLYKLSSQMPVENRELVDELAERFDKAAQRTREARGKATGKPQPHLVENEQSEDTPSANDAGGSNDAYRRKIGGSYDAGGSNDAYRRKIGGSYDDPQASFAYEEYISIYPSSLSLYSDAKSEHSFAFGCFKILNELTAVTFTATESQLEFLERFKDRYTLEEVRDMLQGKIEAWGSSPSMKQNLNPKVLFSAKHFADYMENSKIQLKEPPQEPQKPARAVSKAKGTSVPKKRIQKSPEALERENFYRNILDR